MTNEKWLYTCSWLPRSLSSAHTGAVHNLLEGSRCRPGSHLSDLVVINAFHLNIVLKIVNLIDGLRSLAQAPRVPWNAVPCQVGVATSRPLLHIAELKDK